jgi:hypothetical protein
VQTVQGNLLQSLRAVEEFLDVNAARLEGVVNTGVRQKLGETISALEMYVAEQAGSSLASQGATQRNRALRTVLVRDHMAPIARLVQAELPPAPEVDALRMPNPAWSIERLAAAAHGMAQAAAPFTDAFVAAGMKPDFVTRLTAAADAVIQAVSDRAQSRGKMSGATKGLKTTLASGRRLVRAIDAFVASEFANDPALLANWKRVKRVRKVPVRSDTANPAPLPGTLKALPPVAAD